MKLNLILVGNLFIYNRPLTQYITRKVQQSNDFISSITYFKDSDNSLFLYLEEILNSNAKTIIVTTKSNFSTVGKLISTVTSDNQVLTDGILVPSKSLMCEEGSYVVEHKEAFINVIHLDDKNQLPNILIREKDNIHVAYIFNEHQDTASLLLEPIAQTYEVTFTIVTLVDGFLRVEVHSKKYGNMSKFILSAKQLLSKKLIDTPKIVPHIIERLSQENKKITFAESCTGGLLSYYFTKHNGASTILNGSLVAYSNILKENWLAVNSAIIEEHGAVSNEVVAEMSEGALNVSGADYAISISGVAGDGGGSDEKPVGRVHIGVRDASSNSEEQLQFGGDRNYVQEQSALYAIKMLILSDEEMFF